jgi:glycosyltransferase involved in cell wall biosynthesis
MFTNTFAPHVGGVAKSVAAFAADLRRRGHQVLVVAPTFPGTKAAADDENLVLRVPAIQNFNGSDFSVRLPLPGGIHQRIVEFAPDIIHSHHPFLLGDAALRAARHRRLPLVFTHHTLYERYTHYVPFDSPAMKRFAIHLGTRYANLCQLVIAPSESLADLLHRREVETPLRVVPTGVDTEFFTGGQREDFRRRLGIGDDDLVVGHLGRLAPEKNLPFLARAVARYLQAEPRARFLVAGKGPSADGIKAIFAQGGLSGRLHLIGQLAGDELRDCYAAMDVFAFASTSETQGMVLTEAMAAGTPVIALDASGVREVVRDRHNGRLLPAQAGEEEFAAALADFFGDSQRIAKWRQEALKAAALFSREVCTEKLEDAYRWVAAQILDTAGNGLGAWDGLLRTVQAEWELASEKARAMLEAVRRDEASRTDLE